MTSIARNPRYRRLSPAVILVLLLSVFASADARGQSIWAQRDPWRAFQFSDTSARRLGDLVTIVIRENTDVANRDQRQLAKDTDAGLKFDFASAADGGKASASLDTSAQSNRKFDGQSQYTVEQQFTDHITTQIVQILPNGNFMVSGQRVRNVSGEIRQLTVTGIVRPIDINPDNTVESRFIADFRIHYSGTGAESKFTNQGWLGRIGNRVWPF